MIKFNLFSILLFISQGSKLFYYEEYVTQARTHLIETYLQKWFSNIYKSVHFVSNR